MIHVAIVTLEWPEKKCRGIRADFTVVVMFDAADKLPDGRQVTEVFADLNKPAFLDQDKPYRNAGLVEFILDGPPAYDASLYNVVNVRLVRCPIIVDKDTRFTLDKVR